MRLERNHPGNRLLIGLSCRAIFCVKNNVGRYMYALISIYTHPNPPPLGEGA